jgi:hypothetical protein
MRQYLAALTFAALPILCFGAVAADAQERTAAGLWQQVDPLSGEPQGWFLITDRNGTFNGAIVRMFLQPWDPPDPVCSLCIAEHKDEPFLGLTIINGMVRKGLNYEGGTILDPIQGHLWIALMQLSPDGRELTLRHATQDMGNQHWQRLPDCAYAQLDPSIITAFKLTVPEPAAPGAEGERPARPDGC